MNKPLTKDGRAELAILISRVDPEEVAGDIYAAHGEFCIASDNCNCSQRAADVKTLLGKVTDLLAAEAFWRGSIKNARPDCYTEYGAPYPTCPFCGEEAACQQINPSNKGEEHFQGRHKDECPWILAHE